MSDQFLQYYQTQRQTHKYWKTLFYHCIDIAVTNAYILYKETMPDISRSRYDHKAFVIELVRELLLAASVAPPLSSPVGRPYRSSVRASHRLAYQQDYKYCVLCKAFRRYNKTDKYCIACNVSLCFTHSHDCFAVWRCPSCDTIRQNYMQST